MQLERLVDQLIPLAYAGVDSADWQLEKNWRTTQERDQVDRLCDELQHLALTTLGPDKFFEYFIQKTAHIYRARAVAIWVLDEENTQPCLAAEGSTDSKRSTTEVCSQVEFMKIQFEARQPSVEPVTDSGVLASGFAEKNDSVVWGPVRANEQTIAVIAVNLGSGRSKSSETAAGYLARMEHLAGCLLDYLRHRHRRAELPTPSFASVTETLELTKELVDVRRESIRDLIEEDLGRLAGIRFGTLQENRDLAAKAHELLDANGLRAQCPECGSPAILRCINTGNSKTGVFSFDHYVDGRRKYHCGVTSFPRLKICNKPLRRQRSSNTTS